MRRLMFDFNGNGKLDVFEQAVKYQALESIFYKEEKTNNEYAQAEIAGFDSEPYMFMNEDEELDDYGQDPYDYDFCYEAKGKIFI